MAMALSPTTPFFLDFKDKNGKRASVKYYLNGLVVDPEDSEPAALTAATVALSNLSLISAEVAPFAIEASVVTPDTGPYDRVQDKSKLNFQCADGSKTTVELPGPIAADFTSTSINVDPTASAIGAVIDYITANCCSAEGQAIVRFTGGIRMRPSGQKKH